MTPVTALGESSLTISPTRAVICPSPSRGWAMKYPLSNAPRSSPPPARMVKRPPEGGDESLLDIGRRRSAPHGPGREPEPLAATLKVTGGEDATVPAASVARAVSL